jgi:hypothetical protein
MKHFLIALLLTSILFASCEKEVIVIIEEEEIMIDSIDMEQFGLKLLDGFSINSSWELPNKITIEHRYFHESDSVNLNIRLSLLGSHMEAMMWLINDIQNSSAAFYPGTEDKEPLGDEYWKYPNSNNKVIHLCFRRHNAVFHVFSHNINNITPFAQYLDQAILDREDFVYFRESQE